jgi:aminoacylase
MDRSPEELEADVNLFKEYLRIDTRHPKPDFAKTTVLYQKWADELGGTLNVVECVAGWPNYIITVKGTDPSLQSIGLCCHTDVVPVVADRWTDLPAGETPFSAWESPDGKIYARGAQDMKVVGAAEVCALRTLKQQSRDKKLALRRDVHLIFMPDEEVGGANGMAKLVHTEEFRRLNLGLTLDEGLAHDENRFVIFTGERTPLWVTFKAEGPMGHGAKLVENTAMDRLARVVTRMTALRDENLAKIKAGADLGDVTTFNWNAAEAGVRTSDGKIATNMIPREGAVTFDVRVALPDFEKVTALWREWARELDLQVVFDASHDQVTKASPYSRTDTAAFAILRDTIAGFGAEVTPRIFPAATDSRYVRRAGVMAYGFSAMRNLPSLLHDHNEYCPRSTFLEGVSVYARIIPALANTTGDLNAAVGPVSRL